MQPFNCLPNGRLCGGAHEMSGIKAPLFLCGGGGGVWCAGGGCCGCGRRVDSVWCPPCYFCSWKKTMHLIGKITFVLRKKITWGVLGVSDAPHDTPMLFFDNLVKKLDNLSTSNIDIYPSTLEICINNLLKLVFFESGPPPPTPQPHPYQRPPHPPWKSYLCPIFSTKSNIFSDSQCLDYLSNQMHAVLTWNTPIFDKIDVFHICLVMDGMIWSKIGK